MIDIAPSVYFLGALLVLTVPLNWLAAAICAAVFHELCHILAILLSGEKIHRIRIGYGGTVIDTGPLEDKEELFCALAGPAGSFALVLGYRIFPRLAVCAVIQGLFNLLPIWPLDGGRVLRCLLHILSPENAGRAEIMLKHLLLLILFLLSLRLSAVFSLGLLPLFLAAVVRIKDILRKKPCKQGRIGVQ